MPPWFDKLKHLLEGDTASAAIRAALIVFAGLVAARYGGRGLARLLSRRSDSQQSRLVQRLSSWLLFGVALAWALQELGFNLGVVLGAAGVLTVAIGFASQTSLSNLISGFFLFGERPFKVGDIVEVEGTSGEVLSIDLMATKLRTFDNHFVRIPNEVMIKTKVVNLTRFPIRRLDLVIPVAYREDLVRVRQILFDVATDNAFALDEPAPLFFVTDFGDSFLRAQFSIWCETDQWLMLKSSLTQEIKAAFDEHNVRFPYPQRVLYSGSGTPWPVTMTDQRG